VSICFVIANALLSKFIVALFRIVHPQTPMYRPPTETENIQTTKSVSGPNRENIHQADRALALSSELKRVGCRAH